MLHDNPPLDQRREAGRVAAWLAIVFLAWAIIPALTMPNITLDAAEGLIWGRNWRLGYEKHPPLQAWLLEACRLAFGPGPMAHVWLSAACACLTHWAVWRTARRYLEPATAFWVSAALQCVHFHTYTIPEFNPNVLQLPVFAFAGLNAVHALERGRVKDWLLLGLTIGIGLYAKYSVALAALAIALFFVIDPAGRRRLAAPGPWLGAGVALLAFAPHLAWLGSAEGASVTYVVRRAQLAPDLAARLFNVAEVLANILLMPLVLILAAWLGRGRGGVGDARRNAAQFASVTPPMVRLAVWLAVAPLALTVLMAVVAGFRIKSAWLAPLFTQTPLCLFLLFRADARLPRFRGARITVLVMAVLGLVAYAGSNLLTPYLAGKTMRVHFPGAALAQEVDRVWSEAFDQPLKFVIGDTLEAGSVGHYSRFAPLVRVRDDEAANPWAPNDAVLSAGAAILWDADNEGDALPARIAAARPEARVAAIVTLRQQTGAPVAPARIGIAILPPAGKARR